MAYKHFFVAFLSFHHPIKFHLGILKFDMGIGVPRDADIRIHRHEPFTTLGLGILDDVLHLPGAQQLMV